MFETLGISGLVVALGFVAATYRQLAAAFKRFRSMAITHVTVSGDSVDQLLFWFDANMKSFKFGDMLVRVTIRHVASQRQTLAVGTVLPPKMPRIYYGRINGKFVVATIASDGVDLDTKPQIKMSVPQVLGVSPRWLLKQALDWVNQERVAAASREDVWIKSTPRCYVYKVIGNYGRTFSANGNGSESPASPPRHNALMSDFTIINDKSLINFDPTDFINTTAEYEKDCFAMSALQTEALQDAKRWYASAKWYRERAIPWRRAWHLTGKPGSGKSAFVYAVAKELNVPVFSFALPTLTNQDLISRWGMHAASSPAIFLLEDFDRVFEGSTNIHGKDPGAISFDTVLNLIGGIEPYEGIFVIVTTNDYTKVSDALGIPIDNSSNSSRPGRLDKVYQINNADDQQRRSLADRLLKDYPDLHARALQLPHDLTVGQYMARCHQWALDRFWGEGNVRPYMEPDFARLPPSDDLVEVCQQSTSFAENLDG